MARLLTSLPNTGTRKIHNRLPPRTGTNEYPLALVGVAEILPMSSSRLNRSIMGFTPSIVPNVPSPHSETRPPTTGFGFSPATCLQVDSDRIRTG
jgi:hypothetical protein